MIRLFDRHRVRASFYHLVSIIFLVSMGLWASGLISDKMSTIISAALFVTDYLAEMYDPHPDTPGPWFRAHFHRMFDKEEEICKYEKIENEFYENEAKKEKELKEIEERFKS